MEYISSRGFNAYDSNNLAQLEIEMNNKLKFKDLMELAVVAQQLLEVNDETCKKLYNKILDGDLLPNDIAISDNILCPICNNVTLYGNDDYRMQADYCIVCDYHSNQFLEWEDMREADLGVLIWNNFFKNRNVEDSHTLERLERLLESGCKPDQLIPKKREVLEFKNKYMNENIVRSGMTEWEKFENTLLMVQFNSSSDSIKELATRVLIKLNNIDRSKYRNGKEVEIKELKRLNLV